MIRQGNLEFFRIPRRSRVMDLTIYNGNHNDDGG